jgi:hypothetical protein
VARHLKTKNYLGGSEMKCCLCDKQIETVMGVSEGHNAQPLAEGRCCSECNDFDVLPARMQGLFQRIKAEKQPRPKKTKD